jgi:dipeptidyl aminopeptidase/acylaminoacyl peptidase
MNMQVRSNPKIKGGNAAIWLSIALFTVGCVGLGYYLFKNPPRQKAASTEKTPFITPITDTPTPTPFPFQEMTIPALREHEYKSKLGKLEMISQNSNFTAYLTSYDSDGLKINAYLTMPKGEQPPEGWPAVVFVHGYIPPEEYSTTSDYISYVNFLANRGLVVFKIDLRGHGKSEGEPLGAYYSEGYVVDTLNAYEALQNAEFVNNKRVGLWGHSMGGNIVFRSMVVNRNVPKTIIWSGAVYTYEDFQEYKVQDNSYQPPPEDSENVKRREKLAETYGGFDTESNFWQQVVPTNYLEGVTGEIQLHHALDDTVVDVGYSRNLVNLLNEAGIKSSLYEYPSGGHNITGASFTQAMQRSSDFLNK